MGLHLEACLGLFKVVVAQAGCRIIGTPIHSSSQRTESKCKPQTEVSTAVFCNAQQMEYVGCAP